MENREGSDAPQGRPSFPSEAVVGVPEELKVAFGRGTTLVVLSGLPGLGKSTLADELFRCTHPIKVAETDWVWDLVCPYGWSAKATDFGYVMVEALVSAWLTQGIHAVVDSTALTRRHRRRWVDVGRELRAAVHCCWFQPDVEEAVLRRSDVLPEARIREMAGKWEEPSSVEGFAAVHRVEPSRLVLEPFPNQVGQG